MNTVDGDTRPVTFYFDNDGDARAARRQLLELGVEDEDISLESSSGKSFLDNIKEFFGVESTDSYAHGALLTVEDADGDPEVLEAVRRYGGRAPDASDRTMTESPNDWDISEDEICIPVTREEFSVEKRPVVTEEIAVGKRTVKETQTVGGAVRKERARVETDGDVTPKGTVDD